MVAEADCTPPALWHVAADCSWHALHSQPLSHLGTPDALYLPCSYCRPRCPPPPTPSVNTTVAFFFDNKPAPCKDGLCVSGTEGRHTCTPGLAFANQQSLLGGDQSLVCNGTAWVGNIAACGVSHERAGLHG